MSIGFWRSHGNSRPLITLSTMAGLALIGAACLGGDDAPDATPTPSVPGPEDALGEWVSQNRSVTYLGDCTEAKQGIDTGKLCSSQTGERGRLRAYHLGPTFSDPTAFAFVQQADAGWTIVSVENIDPSQAASPIIDWPLEGGDAVLIIGLGEGDCLSIRETPSQTARRLNCMPDGTKAIIQEGPTDAETFRWFRIAGDGFNGWAASTWLRLESAVAAAFEQAPVATPEP